jgi:hypothetical protein
LFAPGVGGGAASTMVWPGTGWVGRVRTVGVGLSGFEGMVRTTGDGGDGGLTGRLG